MGTPGLNRDPPKGQAEYSIVVEARMGELAAQQGIRIKLQDSNDNPPRFRQNRISTSIKENVPKGQCVRAAGEFTMQGPPPCTCTYTTTTPM